MIMKRLEASAMTIDIKGKLIDLSSPLVMGIINVTPDSFYSGSRTACGDSVLERIVEMNEQGIDIFDVGGYSSRSGADAIPEEEEWRRLDIGLGSIRKTFPDAIISVDTFRASAARRCVEEWGADIINDISGGTLDNEMWQTVADLKVPYVLMHMRGTPADMQEFTAYNDVTADVISDLASKLDKLRLLGVNDVIIDPGFGFSKTIDQNFRLLSELDRFSILGCPVLAGLSRKSMIFKTLGTSPQESLAGTVALNMAALMKGAAILRVHDVREAVECVSLFNIYKRNSPNT